MSNAHVQERDVSQREINPAMAPLVGLVGYLGAAAIGWVLDSEQPAEQGPAQWAVAGVIAAVAVVIAIAVSRRAQTRGTESMSRTALILGVVAVVTMVVFWAGLPCVFGATAIGLGLASRPQRGRPGPSGFVGVVLGALALIAGLALLASGG